MRADVVPRRRLGARPLPHKVHPRVCRSAPLRIFKFATVNDLALFFPANHGAARATSLSFLGLYGDFMHVRTRAAAPAA